MVQLCNSNFYTSDTDPNQQSSSVDVKLEQVLVICSAEKNEICNSELVHPVLFNSHPFPKLLQDSLVLQKQTCGFSLAGFYR